ncbi:MAG: GNAT family N-acetyltransferase, partial [Pseudomonadota bacterium]
MLTQPILATERLKLRGFQLADAPEVQHLAGEWEIADTTATIPHPYEDGMAEAWIETHPDRLENESALSYAITLADNEQLIGSIGLHINKRHDQAELGYWIGKPWWKGGYCTEAARVLINHGFEVLSLYRIHAHYMARNPASGRVMQKLGMSHEGCLRG